MNDMLKKENPDGTGPPPPEEHWTLAQRAERLQTQARLGWRRLGRQIGRALMERRRRKRQAELASQKRQKRIHTEERRAAAAARSRSARSQPGGAPPPSRTQRAATTAERRAAAEQRAAEERAASERASAERAASAAATAAAAEELRRARQQQQAEAASPHPDELAKAAERRAVEERRAAAAERAAAERAASERAAERSPAPSAEDARRARQLRQQQTAALPSLREGQTQAIDRRAIEERRAAAAAEARRARQQAQQQTTALPTLQEGQARSAERRAAAAPAAAKQPQRVTYDAAAPRPADPRQMASATARQAAVTRQAASPAGQAAARRNAARQDTRQLTLWQRFTAEVRHIRRRWRHIRREQRANRFPESNRLPVQFVLMMGGLFRMWGNHLRERVMGRRHRALRRSTGARERREIGRRWGSALVFFAMVTLITCTALFFSFYTYGTTVTFHEDLVWKLPSQDEAKEAVRELEQATASTLGGSYTISASLLSYTDGLMLRSELTDVDTFQEELSQDIDLVIYAYSLYVNDTFIGSTPYEGALEELLDQMSAGVSGENTIYCGFQEDVRIEPGYVPKERIMNLGYIAETLYSTKMEEVTYTVQSGDTWSRIAQNYGMTNDELLQKNPGYDINRIHIGDVLTMSAAVPYLTLKITQQESYMADIPYQIEYTDTADLYQGQTKTTSPGQFGKADVRANVTYVNGTETERTILSYVHLAEPVVEQQLRGTKPRPTWFPTGNFRWPCVGSLTSRFGYRSSPGGIGSTNHKGIDIANKVGTPIYASDGGTVVYAGWSSGYGYLVRIDHGNGVETYYGHNSSILVSVGQKVYQGQQIAKMGRSGNVTGPHCHFEIRVNGTARNPLNYLP